MGGHTNLQKLLVLNGWTDWHQIWYTCSGLYGNGHLKLNKIDPRDPRGHLGGFRGDQQIKNLRNLSNGWTEWHQILHTCADSSGNGHRLKTITPSTIQGAFWEFQGVKNSNPGKAAKRLDRLGPHGILLQIHLGLEICKYICPSRPQRTFVFFRLSTIQKSGKSTKRLDRLAPNLVHVCGFIWK